MRCRSGVISAATFATPERVQGGNAYLYTVSSSGLSLYWDRNRNGSLTSSGKNQDELIAVLPGLSALGNSDLIAV